MVDQGWENNPFNQLDILGAIYDGAYAEADQALMAPVAVPAMPPLVGVFLAQQNQAIEDQVDVENTAHLGA